MMDKKTDKSEEAVRQIIESSQKHLIATDTGDYKTANKNYHILNKAVLYLMENDRLDTLKNLLIYNDPSVKVWVASYLIKTSGDKNAIKILEEIASKKIKHLSFDAKMVLQEWRKKNRSL